MFWQKCKEIATCWIFCEPCYAPSKPLGKGLAVGWEQSRSRSSPSSLTTKSLPEYFEKHPPVFFGWRINKLFCRRFWNVNLKSRLGSHKSWLNNCFNLWNRFNNCLFGSSGFREVIKLIFRGNSTKSYREPYSHVVVSESSVESTFHFGKSRRK